MKEKNTRLIGDDGELLVAVKVEKPKHPLNSSSLNRRLMLLVLVLILIFGGVAVAVVVVKNHMVAAVPDSPTIAIFPARFVNGPYEIGFTVNVDKTTPLKLPCVTREVRVQIAGNTPVKVHLLSVPDHGSTDKSADVNQKDRFVTFTIPAEEGDVFNINVNDAQDNPLSGITNLGFGTSDFAFCKIGVNFNLARGLR
ncbi:MAG: hypothetical protein H0X30_10765 [Anaerolineae bacterium]|nr:hypothetical protein [Anaerolineae bacterium]